MNAIRFSILARRLPAALLAMAVAVSAAVSVEYQVHFTDEDMTIDGRANEKSWSVAPLAKMVDRAYPNGETLAPSITTVQALWNERGLLVLFQCKDENILARFTERDYQKLYLDNTVELFLDPAMDGTPYVQLIINALNTKSDALYLDPPWTDDRRPPFSNWDSGAESAVIVSGSSLSLAQYEPSRVERIGPRWIRRCGRRRPLGQRPSRRSRSIRGPFHSSEGRG